MMLDRYLAQVGLLLTVLPEIARETAFALKGGTAINLFYRDLPRLSVDLDLTWLPVADRRSSLREIDAALDRITAAIARRYPRFGARRLAGGGGGDTRIMVQPSRAPLRSSTTDRTLVRFAQQVSRDPERARRTSDGESEYSPHQGQ